MRQELRQDLPVAVLARYLATLYQHLFVELVGQNYTSEQYRHALDQLLGFVESGLQA